MATRRQAFRIRRFARRALALAGAVLGIASTDVALAQTAPPSLDDQLREQLDLGNATGCPEFLGFSPETNDRDLLNEELDRFTDDALPGWMRDLAVFHTAYADSLFRAGVRDEANGHWTAALRLIEQQSEITPDDAQLRDDAALLRARLERGLPR